MRFMYCNMLTIKLTVNTGDSKVKGFATTSFEHLLIIYYKKELSEWFDQSNYLGVEYSSQSTNVVAYAGCTVI